MLLLNLCKTVDVLAAIGDFALQFHPLLFNPWVLIVLVEEVLFQNLKQLTKILVAQISHELFGDFNIEKSFVGVH